MTYRDLQRHLPDNLSDDIRWNTTGHGEGDSEDSYLHINDCRDGYARRHGGKLTSGYDQGVFPDDDLLDFDNDFDPFHEDYYDNIIDESYCESWDDHNDSDGDSDEDAANAFYIAWFGRCLWRRMADLGHRFTVWVVDTFRSGNKAFPSTLEARLPIILYDKFAEVQNEVTAGRLDPSEFLSDDLRLLAPEVQKRLLLSVVSDARNRMSEISRRSVWLEPYNSWPSTLPSPDAG
ncbi:hypothetical protein FOZ62_012171 [Perkinsus olseni]|nr:hypothetical protein FOZ62_012171 [Perkinsus olseni]